MWTDDSCAKGKMNITILPYGKFKKGTITWIVLHSRIKISGQEKKWMQFGRITITTYLQQYRAQWTSHTECMIGTRWQKLIISYKPPGMISLGQPLKCWFQSVTDQNMTGWKIR
jgi:hypothetical protein